MGMDVYGLASYMQCAREDVLQLNGSNNVTLFLAWLPPAPKRAQFPLVTEALEVLLAGKDPLKGMVS